MPIIAALFALFLSASSVAATDSESANFIMPGCRLWIQNEKAVRDPFDQGICGGAVIAITRVAAGVCPPPRSTGGQSIRVVVKYIDSIPARQNESFYRLAAEALRKAWPCRP